MIKVTTKNGLTTTFRDFADLVSDCDSRGVFYTNDGRIYSSKTHELIATWNVIN